MATVFPRDVAARWPPSGHPGPWTEDSWVAMPAIGERRTGPMVRTGRPARGHRRHRGRQAHGGETRRGATADPPTLRPRHGTPLELDRRPVPEPSAASPSVGEGLDDVENRRLALQCREAGLGHGVVVGIADRAHRRHQPGLPPPRLVSQRRGLTAMVGVVDGTGIGLPVPDRHSSASGTSRMCILTSMALPATRRLNTSTTAAR